VAGAHLGSSSQKSGIRKASGDLVILLDSDIVTLPDFIEAHVLAHLDQAYETQSDEVSVGEFSPEDKTIVHGRVIYTEDLDNPTSTRKRISDISMAFFAGGTYLLPASGCWKQVYLTRTS